MGLYAYHIFLNIVVLISAFFHFHGVNRIVKILNCCDCTSDQQLKRNSYGYQSVQYAKRRIMSSLVVSFILCAASIINIAIGLDFVFQSNIASQLGYCCSHSFIFIASSVALVSWVYQHKKTCCQLNMDSVCLKYGCDVYVLLLYDICNCCKSYVEAKPERGGLIKIHNAPPLIGIDANARNPDTSLPINSETQ